MVIHRASIACVLGVLLLVKASHVHAEHDAFGREVTESIRDGASALDSFTVSWVQKYMPIRSLTREQTVLELGIKERGADALFSAGEYRVTWDSGRIYTFRKPLDARSEHPSPREAATDGRFLMTRSDHSDGSAYVFKMRLSDVVRKEPYVNYFDGCDYLIAAGWTPPRDMGSWKKPSLKCALDDLLERRGELVSVEKRSATDDSVVTFVIEAPDPWQREGEKADMEQIREELKRSASPPEVRQALIDRIEAKRSLSSRRIYRLTYELGEIPLLRRTEERYADGRPISITRMEGYREIPGKGIKFPERILVEYHSFYSRPGFSSSHPLIEQLFELKELKSGPFPDDTFVLSMGGPGTMVADATLPESEFQDDGFVRYMVPADKDDLENRIHTLGKARAGAQTWLLILLNLVLILVFLAIYIWKKRYAQ